MTGGLHTLRERWSTVDPFDYDPAEILDHQLAAASELFSERRGQIRVLDRRASDSGIAAIERPEDLIPLLFSHTTYKSYPDAFIRDGRWDRLSAWLNTLSSNPIAEVGYDGVADIDDWVARLHAAGHFVMTSSGTTGRTSFINSTAADHDALSDGFFGGAVSVAGAEVGPQRTAFLAMPRGTTTISQLAMTRMASRLAAGGEVRFLTDEPLRAAELARMGALRSAIARGTATADEIAAAEREAQERATRGRAQLDQFVEQILERCTTPLLVAGTYGLIWSVVEVAKGRGIADRSFHPATVMFGGGGLKGVRAPADFLEQMRSFFGPAVKQFEAYGMTELNAPFARCSSGRYHAPPTTLMLILDKAGEQPAEPAGAVVEGRFAALDLTIDGRWGGVISGDRVTVALDTCPCGRRSPGIVEIARYSDLPEGDDKLSCAGAVDSYVRGSIGAWA
jgi:hypothetical protein